MGPILLLRHLSFYSVGFLHLVSKILSFAFPDSIVTDTEFDVTKIQKQFCFVADNSPPYRFVLTSSYRNYLNQKNNKQ
jgi:hypothetical protein